MPCFPPPRDMLIIITNKAFVKHYLPPLGLAQMTNKNNIFLAYKLLKAKQPKNQPALTDWFANTKFKIFA